MNNEYEIRLKAVLDTSDVQQKLDGLRKQQQKMVNQSATNQNKSPENSGNANNATVLNRLCSTMAQTNTTLNNLNSTLQRMIGQNGKNNMPNVPYLRGGSNGVQSFNEIRKNVLERYTDKVGEDLKKFFNPTNFNSPGLSNVQRLKRYPGLTRTATTRAIDSIAHDFNPRFYNKNMLVSPSPNATLQDYWAIHKQYPNGIPRGHIQNAILGSKVKSAGNYFSKMWDGRLSRQFAEPQMGTTGMIDRRLMRWGMGQIGHQVLGQVGDYFDQTGNKTGSHLMGVGQMAVQGAMFGGLAGAGIGLVLGTLNESFKELAERARNLSDAMSDQANRVKEANTIETEIKEKQFKKDEERRLAVGDVGYFQRRIEKTQEKIGNIKELQKEIGSEPGSLSAYEKETQRLLTMFNISSGGTGKVPEWIKERQKKADVYRNGLKQLPTLEEQVEGYKANLESLGVYDEDKQDLIDKARDVKSMGTWQVKALRSITTDDLAEAQKQKDKLIYRSKNGENISLEAFEKVQKEIDTYSDRLKILNEENGRRDDIKKQMDMKYEKQELDRLQDSLSNLKAPGMEQVNSLASQGFAISQNDDDIRWKSQMDYQKEQTNLQREIRNKIMKMSDKQETTYG